MHKHAWLLLVAAAQGAFSSLRGMPSRKSMACASNDYGVTHAEIDALNLARLLAFYRGLESKANFTELQAKAVLDTHDDKGYLMVQLTQKYGWAPELFSDGSGLSNGTLSVPSHLAAVGDACTSIDFLRIDCHDCTDADLGLLSRLTAITGADVTGFSLEVTRSHRLTSLSGLAQVTGALAGGLYVGDNHALESLEGLEGIVALGEDHEKAMNMSTDNAFSIGDALSIQGNNALLSIKALNGLRGPLGGALAVGGNSQLKSLAGLEGLTSLGKDRNGNSLVLWETGEIRDFAGLRGLSGDIPGALRVGENRALRSMNGLGGVTALGWDEYKYSIFCWGNPELLSVAGLAGLKGHAFGTLRFKGNPKLLSLHGLGGVESCRAVEVEVSGKECTDRACLVNSGMFLLHPEDRPGGLRHSEVHEEMR